MSASSGNGLWYGWVRVRVRLLLRSSSETVRAFFGVLSGGLLFCAPELLPSGVLTGDVAFPFGLSEVFVIFVSRFLFVVRGVVASFSVDGVLGVSLGTTAAFVGVLAAFCDGSAAGSAAGGVVTAAGDGLGSLLALVGVGGGGAAADVVPDVGVVASAGCLALFCSCVTVELGAGTWFCTDGTVACGDDSVLASAVAGGVGTVVLLHVASAGPLIVPFDCAACC